jgi:hypothetical protein
MLYYWCYSNDYLFCTVVLSTDPGNGTDTQEFCLLIRQGATQNRQAESVSQIPTHSSPFTLSLLSHFCHQESVITRWRPQFLTACIADFGVVSWPRRPSLVLLYSTRSGEPHWLLNLPQCAPERRVCPKPKTRHRRRNSGRHPSPSQHATERCNGAIILPSSCRHSSTFSPSLVSTRGSPSLTTEPPSLKFSSPEP